MLIPVLLRLPPPWLRWPAPLCASQGRGLSQLGVLGCVAACLYWSVDFLVAACTYLNIPPGHCSVFPASRSPASPPPPHLQPAALPHTLFPALSLLHPTVQSSLLLSFSFPCPVFLLLPGLCFFSHGFFQTFTLDSPPHVDERQSRIVQIKEKVFYTRSQVVIQDKRITQLDLVV